MIKRTVSVNNQKYNANTQITIDNNILKGKIILDDIEIIEKSEKKLRTSELLNMNLNNNYIIEHYYKNEKNEECFKVNSFKGILDKIQEINEFTGSFFNLSKKEMKVKNLLEINENDIKEHFKNIINKTIFSENIKMLLIKQIEKFDDINFGSINNEIYNFKDLMPYLYLDEETNKKIWVIPNGYGQEDIILDYETEIPLFLGNFINYLANEDKKFIVIRKDNIESFYFQKNNCYSYIIESFPEGFILNDVQPRYDREKCSNLFSQTLIEKDLVYLPDITILNIEDTMKILKMVDSNLEIEDLKNKINKYLNVNYSLNIDKDLSVVTSEGEVEKENNIFITNKFDFVENKKTTIKLNNLNLIKRYEPIGNNNLFMEKMEVHFYNTLHLEPGTLNNNYTFNNKNTLLELDNHTDIILPKNKNSYKKDETNNLRRIYNPNGYTLFEDNILIVKQNEHYNRYDLKETIETKENLIHLGKNSLYYLLLNGNGNLFLINKETKETKIIDKTKRVLEVYNIFKSKMDFDYSFGNFKVFITDNKMFYFEDFYNYNLFDYSKTNYSDFNYEEFNKNDKGNYIFKAKIPLLKKEKSLKYSENIKKLDKNFYIKDNKLNLEILKKGTTEIDDKYLITDVTYELDPEFILLNYKNKDSMSNKYDMIPYLHSMKINDIVLKNDEAKDFLNKTKFFDFKNTENNKTIEVNQKDEKNQTKLLISKNNDDNFNLYNYVNNNMVRAELFTLHKKGKINGKKLMPRIEKTVYYSDNKFFIIGKDMTDINSYDYSLKKSLENKESFLNEDNGKKFIFCNNKEIMEIKLDDETNKILKVINLSLAINNHKIVKNIEISL